MKLKPTTEKRLNGLVLSIRAGHSILLIKMDFYLRGGGGGLAGNFGTGLRASILKPAQSYTWPLKKTTHSYT